jgi:hypothetical protein
VALICFSILSVLSKNTPRFLTHETSLTTVPSKERRQSENNQLGLILIQFWQIISHPITDISQKRFDATWCQSTCLEVQLQDIPGCHLHSSGNPYHAVDIFHRSVSKTDNKVWRLTRILVAHRILGAYHKKKQMQSQYAEFYCQIRSNPC